MAARSRLCGIASTMCRRATPPLVICSWRKIKMADTIKVALAGAGAFGIKHLDGIKNIDGVEVISLVGRQLEATKDVAVKYGIPHVATDLASSLALSDVDAVILCTPTQMHATQAIACMK